MNELKRTLTSHDIYHLEGKDGIYQWYTCIESSVIPNYMHCTDGLFDDSLSERPLDQNKVVTMKMFRFMPNSIRELIHYRKYRHYAMYKSSDLLRKSTL